MSKVELLSLPKFLDPRGNLTFIQDNEYIPFKIKRVFWTYDVPGGEMRGGHAFKRQHEVIIALSGSFDVIVETDGIAKTYSLNRSYNALYIPPQTWRHMQNFSTNSLSLHLSSHKYSAEDYIFKKEETNN